MADDNYDENDDYETEYDSEGNPLPPQDLTPEDQGRTLIMQAGRGAPSDVMKAIQNAAIIHNVDPDMLRKFADIESSYNPGARTGSYKGLFQLSDMEFLKHGGGDIYNAQDNANAMASKTAQEMQAFKASYGRDATPIDLYMQHQQGVAGTKAHYDNPEGTAWQNIRRFYGSDAIAKQAIWNNLPASAKRQFGSVDNVTSADFVKAWDNRLNGIGSVPGIIRQANGDKGTLDLQRQLQGLRNTTGVPDMEGGSPVPFIQNVDEQNMFQPVGEQISPGIEPPDLQTKKKAPVDDLPLPLVAFNKLMEIWNAGGEALQPVQQPFTQAAKQAVKGLYDAATSVPFSLGAGVSAGLSPLADALNSPEVQQLQQESAAVGVNPPVYKDQERAPGYKPQDEFTDAPVTGWLLDQAQKMHKGSEFATGVGEPKTPLDNAANAIGMAANPSAVFTAGMAAADLSNRYGLTNKLGGLAAQLFGINPANADEQRRDTHALMSIGAIRGVNYTTADGKQIVLPAITEDGRALTDEQAVDYWMRGGRNIGVIYDAIKAGLSRLDLGPDNQLHDEIIQTAGGPMRVSRRDINAVGIVGLSTIGLMFIPAIAQKAGNLLFARVRPTPVEGGPSGLQSLTTTGDYFRAVGDDVMVPLINSAKRAGVGPTVLDSIRNTMRMQGGSASNTLISSAINLGQMEHPSFHFQAMKSIADMKQQYTDQHFFDYLHLRDTLDELFQIQNNPKLVKKNAKDQALAGLTVGPPMLRGETVQSALSKINQLEKANPEVKQLAQEWQDNLDQVRKFQSRGEYATLTNKQYLDLRRTRKNEVPWIGEKVVDPVNPGERGNPFDAMQSHMQKVMYQRMSNEVRGTWTDGVSHTNVDIAMPVAPHEARMNDYSNTQYTVYRRGKKEIWTTDPLNKAVLELDPYYMSGHVDGVLDGARKLMQNVTTGTLAPQFAPVAGIRNHFIAAMSPEPGTKPTTLGRTLLAIPQQMGPAGARSIAKSLDFLNDYIGSTTVDAISARLWNVYENSFYALMERGGMGHGGFLPSTTNVDAPLSKWVASIQPGPFKSIAGAYKEFLGNIHNAAGFAYARRNRAGRGATDLARMQRDVTGDPFITGSLIGKNGKTLPAPSGTTRLDAAGARFYGTVSSIGRTSPWFNISVQGAKRVAQAYLQDPIRFTGRLWMHTVLPATLAYWWNVMAGKDPNGQSYNDYHMNLRNNYNTMMLQYLAIPGRPAAEGIELPIRFHETAIAARMMEVALDHLFGTNMFDTQSDAINAMKSWGDIIYPGAIPPYLSAPMAAMGVYTGGGPFGGYYTSDIKDNPFDADRQGWSKRAEMVGRAMAAGMADWIGQAAAAYAHTPDELGQMAKISNAAKQGGKRVIEKTPVLRDITGIKPPMSGSNETTEQLFKKSKAIHQLIDFIKAQDETNYAGGWLSTKPRSTSGGIHIDNIMEQNLPESTEEGYFPRAGLPIAEPTNPLYSLFLNDVIQKFAKDATERNIARGKGSKLNPVMEQTGGIGYQTLWKDYGFFKEQVKSMRGIDAGNTVLWEQRMDPQVRAYLEDNKIPTNNPRAAQNFFEQKRQEYARQILFTVRAVEQEFTRRLADPNVRMMLTQKGIPLPDKITIEDLSPYMGQEAPDTWGLQDGGL